MHTPRLPVNPKIITWARERAGYTLDELTGRFSKLPEWEIGKTEPTKRQIQDFSKKVNLPVGYFFFSEPPDDSLPISDFRTHLNKEIERPSPNLFDVLHDCIRRQDWYREYAAFEQFSRLEFIGSADISTSPVAIAEQISKTINFQIEDRRTCATWSEAFRFLVRQIDKAGILVMVSGIVGSNTTRKLNPDEFRGFALSDQLAPLIFVNGRDTKAAQIFTLAHELAHLWIDKSGLSNSGIVIDSRFPREEVWCNAVAAELLVPLAHLESMLRENESLSSLLTRLAKFYRVSTLVVMKRLLDANFLGKDEFDLAWKNELEKLRSFEQQKRSGGDFYRSTLVRVGRTFAKAVVVSTLEDRTLYRDAFQLLGIKRTDTFNELVRQFGIYE